MSTATEKATGEHLLFATITHLINGSIAPRWRKTMRSDMKVYAAQYALESLVSVVRLMRETKGETTVGNAIKQTSELYTPMQRNDLEMLCGICFTAIISNLLSVDELIKHLERSV